MQYESAIEELSERYRRIFSEKDTEPCWAYRKSNDVSKLIHCPIPFVGKNYFTQPVKVLMYASAENLSKYDGYLDDDEVAINRHRSFFERSVKENNTFFPNVHIEPISNGALALCVLHILSRISDVGDISPSVFLETIAFGNYAKFTICPDNKKHNIDYAGNCDYLLYSQPYVAADLEVLQPDYIIMVRSMYLGQGKQKAFVDSHKGNAKVIPIYQMSPRTINTGRLFGSYEPPAPGTLHPTVMEWYSHFCPKSISKPKFLPVFTYLDEVLKGVL